MMTLKGSDWKSYAWFLFISWTDGCFYQNHVVSFNKESFLIVECFLWNCIKLDPLLSQQRGLLRSSKVVASNEPASGREKPGKWTLK